MKRLLKLFFHDRIHVYIKYIIMVLIPVLLSMPAYSAIWFAGTGNDGYINDVNGIFSALSNCPGLQEIKVNNFISENQSGSGLLGLVGTRRKCEK